MSKTKSIAWSCASALVGLLIGTFVISPSSGSDSFSGNIGKILKHKSDKAVDATDLALIESKLKADSTYLIQTTYSLAFMNSRISEFKEYAALTSDVVADIPQLQPYVQQMKDLGEFATNAQNTATAALASLGRLTKPKDADKGAASDASASSPESGASASWTASPDASFEELSNNAVLSYMMLDKGLATTRNFVSDVDAFLKGKNIDQYLTLAYLRDAWVSFNLVDAVLNEDKTSISFWDNTGYTLSAKESLIALGSMANTQQNSLAFYNTTANAAFFNAGILQQSLNNASNERLGAGLDLALKNMNTSFYGSNIILGPATGVKNGLKDASLNQNDVASLNQNDVASLNQNDVATLNQNDVASLNQNDVASLNQNDVATLNQNLAESLNERAMMFAKNAATLNLNDPSLSNALASAAIILSRDGSISTLSYVRMNTDNAGLQNAQNAGLQNAQNAGLQNAQNSALQNAQNAALQNAQNAALQNAQNAALQNAQNAGLQNAQNAALQNAQNMLQNMTQYASGPVMGAYAFDPTLGTLGILGANVNILPSGETNPSNTSQLQSQNSLGYQMQSFNNLNTLSSFTALNSASKLIQF